MRRCAFVLLLLATAGRAQELREEITVERIIIDARVTDASGDPILNLGPGDFQVRVDGKAAEVAAVSWIPETVAARELASIDDEAPPASAAPAANFDEPLPQGRLFIYFVQTDFARENPRIAGQMKFLPYARQMIEALEPGDRVAVFSFDSHLKFRLDFSDRKSDIERALEQAMLIDEPPPPRPVPSPSLARRLDAGEMKRATSSDIALILIANAVRNIPGPKSMLLFGWGLGHRVGKTVVMDSKYPIARYALESSRVTVFALDTTIADYHDLEFGLKRAAADTGGFYAKTHVFPQIAVDRLQRTLAGHYELEVRKPAGLRPGTHMIDTRVKRRGAVVMARTSYQDLP